MNARVHASTRAHAYGYVRAKKSIDNAPPSAEYYGFFSNIAYFGAEPRSGFSLAPQAISGATSDLVGDRGCCCAGAKMKILSRSVIRKMALAASRLPKICVRGVRGVDFLIPKRRSSRRFCVQIFWEQGDMISRLQVCRRHGAVVPRAERCKI